MNRPRHNPTEDPMRSSSPSQWNDAPPAGHYPMHLQPLEESAPFVHQHQSMQSRSTTRRPHRYPSSSIDPHGHPPQSPLACHSMEDQSITEESTLSSPSPTPHFHGLYEPSNTCSENRQLSDESLALLRDQGFTAGLAKALVANADSFALRIWVLDNSGSMEILDGHRMVETDGKILAKPASRWEELQDTAIYHAQMAALLNSFTRFRLLNDPGLMVGNQEMVVGRPNGDRQSEIHEIKAVIQRARTDGVTPLTRHVIAMQEEIRAMLPKLRRRGRRVAVILATDGIPTDGQGYGGDDITEEFVSALRDLEGLPVWVVIRLCTDEDNITEFYNKLDGLLDLNLEVLDDFMGESKEVQLQNPWLNYALPMHRCRELGYHDRLFDLLDERPLTKAELRLFCCLLFGTEIEEIPDPVTEWKDFIRYVEKSLEHESPQWNSLKKKKKPWISVKKLNRIYNQTGLFGRAFG